MFLYKTFLTIVLQGLPVSGNKQDLIERLQNSLPDEGDDLLDQVTTLVVISDPYYKFFLRMIL